MSAVTNWEPVIPHFQDLIDRGFIPSLVKSGDKWYIAFICNEYPNQWAYTENMSLHDAMELLEAVTEPLKEYFDFLDQLRNSPVDIGMAIPLLHGCFEDICFGKAQQICEIWETLKPC